MIEWMGNIWREDWQLSEEDAEKVYAFIEEHHMYSGDHRRVSNNDARSMQIFIEAAIVLGIVSLVKK